MSRTLAGSAPLVLFAVEVATMSRWEWYDAGVAAWARTLAGCQTSRAIATLSNCEAYLSGALVAAATLSAYRRGLSRRSLAVILVALGVALALAAVLKALLERSRPGALPWGDRGGSFPSAHIMNAALTMFAAVTILRAVPGSFAPRWLVWSSGAAFVVMMMWTRVYLGRHWLTDVVGSALLAPGVWWLVHPRLDARRPAIRVVCAGIGTGVLAIAVLAGARLPLGSPADLTSVPVLAADAAVVPAARDTVRFVLPRDGRVVVKAVVVPTAPARRQNCAWLSVRVDGEVVGVRPLKPRWQAIVFAVPLLAAGPHIAELTTAFEARDVRSVGVSVFALQVESGGACLAHAAPLALPGLEASAGLARTASALSRTSGHRVVTRGYGGAHGTARCSTASRRPPEPGAASATIAAVCSRPARLLWDESNLWRAWGAPGTAAGLSGG